ncbi:MAG: FtsX-like permease family protein [Chloroflexi bacterium]|nr:FtsX-like permease family protein [Chloroflexota bacterium]
MLGTRGRKILRDIIARRFRTLLVSSSIFVGVVGVIALLTVRDLITSQLDTDIRQDELTMIDVDVSLKSNADPASAETLALLNQQHQTGQAIATLDGIERVEGQAYYPIKFKNPETGQFTSAEIRAYSSPLQDVQLEPMRLVEGGDWPVPGEQEIALETRMAERYGFAVDDEIVLRVGDHETSYTVVGLIFHPYAYKRFGTSGALLPGPEDGIYIQYPDLQNLLSIQGYSRFVARYESFALAEERFEDFQRVLREHTPYLPRFPILEDPTENTQVQNAETFANILSLLAVVAMIVSGFLVINVVNTIVVEQKQQIGVLKSLGASQVDTYLIYGGIALAYGVIGTLLAIVPGIIVGYQLSTVLAPQLDIFIDSFRWSPGSVVVGIVLGIIVPLFASAVPVYNGTRITIFEAMTDLGIKATYGEGPAANFVARLPLPPTLRQAINNIIQKKGRLALIGITLTLAIGASMGIFALGISLGSAVDAIINRVNYEITVIPNDINDIETTRQTLKSLPQVTEVNPGVVLSVQIVGDYENFFTRNNQVIAFGIDPAKRDYIFRYKAGEGWRNDSTRDGVVLSAPMANQIDVDTGDEITFITGGGRQATKPLLATEDVAFDAFWIQWEQLALLAGFTSGGPVPNRYAIPATSDDYDEGLIAGIGIDPNGAALLYGEALPEGTVLVTEALATDAGLEIGDPISVTLQGKDVERTIAGLVAADQVDALAGDFPAVPEALVFFDFNDLIAITGAETGDTPLPNAYYVVTNLEDPTPEDVDEVVEIVEIALAEQNITAEIQNQIEQFTEISDLIVQYTAILSIAAILIAGVGSIGLLTTLTIMVFERQKEIGVMRSIGASSTTIAIQFLVEGLLVGLIAWVVGIPVSYGLARLLYAAFRLETVAFSYPPQVLVLGLLGMIVVTALASLGPALSAARKTVSEILRYR